MYRFMRVQHLKSVILFYVLIILLNPWYLKYDLYYYIRVYILRYLSVSVCDEFYGHV